VRYLFSLLTLFFVIDFSIAQQEADILLNGVISAEENQIKNLADPTDPNDAANKAYVDDKIFPNGVNDGDILVWNSNTNSWEITTLDNNLSSATSEVETIEATNITFNTAQAGGVISTDGGSTITEKGIVWSENPDPTVDLETKTNEGGGASNFESVITGLIESTEYFYRAYSTNSSGTSYGNTYVFQTDSAAGYDQDGDGFTPDQGDCDDSNPSIYPDAIDIYDEIDNDCDGEVDENADQDGDGFTPEEGDCDDLDSSINPYAVDSGFNSDGIDNDCDGIIDECDYNGELFGYNYTGVNPKFIDYSAFGVNFETVLTQIDENSFNISSAWGPEFIGSITNNNEDYIGIYQYPATITINEDFSISVVALFEETPAAPEGTVSTGTYDPCTQTFYYELQQTVFTGVGNAVVFLTTDPQNADYTDLDGDGYFGAPGSDCDDNDYFTNPGAIEILNGVDDDCDGLVDYEDDNVVYCGNGIVDTVIGETCDDGNDDPTDGCNNCSVELFTYCSAGVYTIQMWDGYGDGWQSDGLQMTVNGVTSTYTIPSGNYNSATVNVEASSQITWYWYGDSYPEEVLFSITTPNGDEYYFKGAEELLLYSNGLFPEGEGWYDSATILQLGQVPLYCYNN